MTGNYFGEPGNMPDMKVSRERTNGKEVVIEYTVLIPPTILNVQRAINFRIHLQNLMGKMGGGGGGGGGASKID